VAARTLFLGAADQAAAGFRGHADDLERLEADITTATRSAAEEVNGLTRALARVNEELRRTQAGGTTAAGLLDTRDRLLGDLASLVRISVTEGDKGVVSVRLGSGAAAALIVPAVGNPVRIGVQDNAGAGAEIVLDPGHDPTPLRLPASGRLAGLVEATRSVRAARADHDALAGRFAAALNDWHSAGTDALGQPGTPLFATETLKVRAGLANAGTAAVDISLADGASLFPGGYRLIRGASDFTLERGDGSASVSGPGPLILDGITLRLGPGAVPGDAWDLQPASGAAGLSLRQITAAGVAAARRFTVDAGVVNSTPALPTVFADPAAAGLIPPPPWTILVTGPGAAEIIDPAGTVLASVPADGSLIEGPGFRFSLPAGAVGDSFRLALTGPASADNGHALALAGVRALAGPDGTLEAAQDAAMARMGAALSDTDRLAEAAAAVKDDTQRAADLVSGVDLNREAAELTRLQVAYRANAQVIATARALFDTIFGLAA
jgi:flagellar hook-associated protein 1 FlgK